MMYNWQAVGGNMMPFLGWGNGLGMVFFALLLVWSLAWKGIALWHAARAGSKPWFVALLLINTAGLLEILYIYVFSKKSHSVKS